MAKCTALEAANYLVYLMAGVCKDLSNMKLNKILYYAQGQSLLQTGSVLFDDTIEAWDHGPVVDKVYQKYRGYDDGTITEYDAEQAQKMPSSAAELLLQVARKYGQYTASALRNKTHVPQGPWYKAYVRGQRHVPIPVDSIKRYFETHENVIGEVQLNLSDEDFEGHRDEDGYLVLPKDWDDDEAV